MMMKRGCVYGYKESVVSDRNGSSLKTTSVMPSLTEFVCFSIQQPFCDAPYAYVLLLELKNMNCWFAFVFCTSQKRLMLMVERLRPARPISRPEILPEIFTNL
ncbi:hypothetical protein Droror1_Dr00017402 [Drosera rotundifolia]